jgi:hypothetical protein
MASDAIIASGIAGLVVLAVLFAIRSARQAKANRLQMQEALGLSPVEATPELTDRVNRLYRSTRRAISDKPGTYTLRNISGRKLKDGALFVLDVIETSRSEHNQSESQTILIVASDLSLPPFVILPRADVDGLLPSLANRMIEWVVSKWGDPVPFPESPDFERRYLLSSLDEPATRAFFTDELLGQLAETRLLSVQAAGDTFTVSRPQFVRQSAQSLMEARIDDALAVLALFRSRSRA